MLARTRRIGLFVVSALTAAAVWLAVGQGAHAASRVSPSLASARSFFVAELHEKLDGRWDAAWRSLYPPHRRVTTRDAFLRCERSLPFAAPLRSLRVVGVHRALVRVPGVARPVAGVAVETEVSLEWYGPRDPIVFRHAFHLVPVAGSWTWLLSPERYALYADGACSRVPAA
jgi:hypothetical protein